MTAEEAYRAECADTVYDDGCATITAEALRRRLYFLALMAGCSSRFALYDRLAAGDFAGTALEVHAKCDRFLLEEE